MTPLSDSSRPSSSSKHTFLASLRRGLTAKPKRESEWEGYGEYVPKPRVISSLTTSKTPSQSLHASRTPVPPSGRIRVSGSRLPSGYRPTAVLKTTQAIVPPIPELPSSEPELTPRAPPRLRTRLARFLPLHSTPASSTPTSSTFSFPSSSSGTSESTSSSAPTPTASRKQVRFLLNANPTRADDQEHGKSKSPQEQTKVRKWDKKSG